MGDIFDSCDEGKPSLHQSNGNDFLSILHIKFDQICTSATESKFMVRQASELEVKNRKRSKMVHVYLRDAKWRVLVIDKRVEGILPRARPLSTLVMF